MLGCHALETTRPPAHLLGGQQERFNAFKTCFNEQRPHEAIDMQTPASIHMPSSRPYREAETYDDSRVDDVRVVPLGGTIPFLRSTVGITAALAGQEIGRIELDDDVWLVHFCRQDLGLFEVAKTAFSPLETHHREAAPACGVCLPTQKEQVSRMCRVRGVTPVPGCTCPYPAAQEIYRSAGALIYMRFSASLANLIYGTIVNAHPMKPLLTVMERMQTMISLHLIF